MLIELTQDYNYTVLGQARTLKAGAKGIRLEPRYNPNTGAQEWRVRFGMAPKTSGMVITIPESMFKVIE